MLTDEEARDLATDTYELLVEELEALEFLAET